MTGQPKPPRLADSLANLIGEAVGDIREKLVEEAWFGRAVTRPSFDDFTKSLYGHSVDQKPDLEPAKSPAVEMDR